MSITEEDLDTIAGLFVGRLSAVSDRNPGPMPSGEDQRRRLKRQRTQLYRELFAVRDSISEARAELSELTAYARTVTEDLFELEAKLGALEAKAQP